MIFPYCLPATNLSCDLPDLPWTIFQLQQGPGTNVFIVRGSRFLRTFHAQPGNCQPLPSQYCGKWCKHIHIYHWVIYNIIILNILLYIYIHLYGNIRKSFLVFTWNSLFKCWIVLTSTYQSLLACPLVLEEYNLACWSCQCTSQPWWWTEPKVWTSKNDMT